MLGASAGPSQVLRFRIGASLIEVLETLSFPANSLLESDLLAIDRPIRIEYLSRTKTDQPDAPGRELKLELPEAAMASMRVYAGHLVSLRTLPQLKRLRAHEGVSLAQEISGRIEAAGWYRRSHPEVVLPSAALDYLARLGPETGIESMEICFGIWDRHDGAVKDERLTLYGRFETMNRFCALFSKRGSINADCKLTFIAGSFIAEAHFDKEIFRLRKEDDVPDPAPRRIPDPIESYVARVLPVPG
jgi:hypothetical protein